MASGEMERQLSKRDGCNEIFMQSQRVLAAESRGHEIGFEVGSRAASPIEEGREMIGWKGDGK